MKQPTFKQLKAELAALNVRIEAQRSRELVQAIETCKEIIELFDLTAFDLGLVRTQQLPTKRAAPPTFRQLVPRARPEPKYRDPATGETWSGRGRVPNWMADATDRDDFLIG